MYTKFLGTALTAFLTLAGVQSDAAFIDFEDAAARGLGDEAPVTNQYQSEGVIFELIGGGAPVLEASGGSDSGSGFLSNFATPSGGPSVVDTARSGFEQRLGDFFMKIPGSATTGIEIRYEEPVAAASGDIWDIDSAASGTEQWRVQAFDASGNLLQTVDSPISLDPCFENEVQGVDCPSANLDGLPWRWALQAPSGANEISRIDLTFIGSKSGAPIGFDAFSTDRITDGSGQPVQTSLPPLAGLLAAGAFACHRARRKVQLDR